MAKARRAQAAVAIKFASGAFAEAEGLRQTEHDRHGLGRRAGGEDSAAPSDESPRLKGTRQAHHDRHERHISGSKRHCSVSKSVMLRPQRGWLSFAA
jgi:hypothetical protein